MTQEADSVQCADLEAVFAQQDKYSGYAFFSAEQALDDYISWYENPTDVLNFNPLTANYEVHPSELYSHPDSLAVLTAQLEEMPGVANVGYMDDVAELVSRNVHRGSLILLVVALVLLLVSMVLIVNTIRLQIYAKRFLINTMTLVGATPWMIRRPFVWKNVLMGFIAGMAALLVLGGIVYYAHAEFDIELFTPSLTNIGFVTLVVLGSGIIITLFSSLIATGRYIRMDNNTLYEI